MKKHIDLIVGARPNFMKAAPLMAELRKYPDRFSPRLIHTGQHYDHNLSQMFFEQLKMPKPDIFLGVGSGTHAEQTAKIMIGLEQEFVKNRPDFVIVFGDVNSTLATAIVAAKLDIRLGHVESGLRSFDNTMPEEINRIVTDRLSDLLFVSEKSGLENLEAEGVHKDKVFFTGNIMIDSLINNFEVADQSDVLSRLMLTPKEYVAMTLHRPANVDSKEIFGKLLAVINKIGEKIPIIFPCHPRAQKNLEEFGLLENINPNALKLITPLGYLDFLKLQSEARFILTDSGGIQEETTYLNIPCITMRNNTERPITVEIGSNIITGVDPEKVLKAANEILEGRGKKGRIPDLWDGKTAERIVAILLQKL